MGDLFATWLPVPRAMLLCVLGDIHQANEWKEMGR